MQAEMPDRLGMMVCTSPRMAHSIVPQPTTPHITDTATAAPSAKSTAPSPEAAAAAQEATETLSSLRDTSNAQLQEVAHRGANTHARRASKQRNKRQVWWVILRWVGTAVGGHCMYAVRLQYTTSLLYKKTHHVYATQAMSAEVDAHLETLQDQCTAFAQSLPSFEQLPPRDPLVCTGLSCAHQLTAQSIQRATCLHPYPPPQQVYQIVQDASNTVAAMLADHDHMLTNLRVALTDADAEYVAALQRHAEHVDDVLTAMAHQANELEEQCRQQVAHVQDVLQHARQEDMERIRGMVEELLNARAVEEGDMQMAWLKQRETQWGKLEATRRTAETHHMHSTQRWVDSEGGWIHDVFCHIGVYGGVCVIIKHPHAPSKPSSHRTVCKSSLLLCTCSSEQPRPPMHAMLTSLCTILQH